MRLLLILYIFIVIILGAVTLLPRAVFANTMKFDWMPIVNPKIFSINVQLPRQVLPITANQPVQNTVASITPISMRAAIVTFPTSFPLKKPSPNPVAINSASTGEKTAYIMNEINIYRRSNGLSEVKTDPNTCGFANTRAAEITSGFSHDGFNNRISSKTLPYPSYTLVTENLAMNSDYRKVAAAWINSAGHAENMHKDTPYVCVQSNGNYYAYEGWKP